MTWVTVFSYRLRAWRRLFPASRSYQIGLDMIDEGAMTSMGFVWIKTVGNDRAAQIEAGRAYRPSGRR